MNRQCRRRIKRKWDRIPYFSDCTAKIDIEELPNTAVDVSIKISEDLVLQYYLDMFQRWRLYSIIVTDGFPFRDSFCAIGMASDEWMDVYFNDERFENLVATRNVWRGAMALLSVAIGSCVAEFASPMVFSEVFSAA